MEDKKIMVKTIWYRGKNNGLYMQEELKLIYMEENPKEKFNYNNFLAWIDNKEFIRID